MKVLPLIIGILLLVGTSSAVVTQFNSTIGGETIWLFNGTGTLSDVVIPSNGTAQILIVAGGASGGGGTAGAKNGGGGGAGGVLNGTLVNLTPSTGTYNITVGSKGGAVGAHSYGINGTLSSFAGWIALGGGGGAPENTPAVGYMGGSGGGGAGAAGGTATQTSISPLTGYGNAGGTNAQGGGGGGAGAVGGSTAPSGEAAGFDSSITGTLTTYSKGGSSASSSSGGEYGSGGDGKDTQGYAGMDGVVILRFTIPTATLPISSFTSNVTMGTAPLAVQFNDTSITSPTAWNWSYINVTPGNNTQVWWSTIQNATQTFGNGHWHINLNVTNASGFNNTELNYPITVSDSGIYSGFNRQDILMDQIYTLTLNIKDATTHNGIPNAIVQTSLGDNTTTDLFGVATFSMNYTALVVSVGATGYYSRTVSYVVDRDRSETIYLTPEVEGASANTNIVYIPKQIEIVVMYYNPAGVVVPGSHVSLTAIDNTLQADSQLQTLYGINPIAANQLMNGTLTMNGTTDSSGGIVFTVLQSINYQAQVTDPLTSTVYTATLFPGMDPYTIWIGTNPIKNATENAPAAYYLNTTKLYITQPDRANITMNLAYQDRSGLTTSVSFIVKYANNNTIAYTSTVAAPGSGTIYKNYTAPNIRGQGYWYGYNYTRT